MEFRPKLIQGIGSNRLLLSVIVASFPAIVLALFLSLMHDAYESATRAAYLSTGNLAASLSHDVERNAEMLDRSLQGVVRAWNDPRVQSLPKDVRDMVLFDYSASAEGFGAIVVLDKDGSVVASSQTISAPINVSGRRDYFLVHQSNTNIGLYVSRPFQTILGKDWVVGLSRRIDGPDGKFAGVVVGTMKIAYLESLFASVDLGNDGGASLLRLDGTIVAHVPTLVNTTRMNLHADNDRFDLLRVQSAGVVRGASSIDGEDRITSFHRVGQFPLIQVVEVRADEVYAEWRQKLLVLGLVLLSLSLGTLTLIVLLNKELVRRTKAEDELGRLARTDPLTLLPNRRQFDEVLAREWLTALREGTNISLLMIDADYFKLYNDALGHPAGDTALKLIAERISACVHRPSDLACRIGGEEFAVLLPRTGSAGAMTVGEAIRLSIERLASAHPGSPFGSVTVSVGVTSMRPRKGHESDELLARADRALYEAKEDGRNRICLEAEQGIMLAA